MSANEIWKARCGGCHGENGEGSEKKKVPDLRVAAWHEKHDDAAVRAAIEGGSGGTKMKAFKGKMSAEQLAAVIAKIRGFKK